MLTLPDEKQADNRDKEAMTIVVASPLADHETKAIGIHVAHKGHSQ
jgi:hypothetical protein